jgi:hypothetical protein
MKPPAVPAFSASPLPTPGQTDDRSTGLPWLRTWTAVYLFVFGTFVFWIVLLAALSRMFA